MPTMSNTHDPANEQSTASGAAAQGRPFIGVHFECCGVYARIYRRPEQAFYVGRCPRCLRELRVRVGPNGTSTRIFSAR